MVLKSSQRNSQFRVFRNNVDVLGGPVDLQHPFLALLSPIGRSKPIHKLPFGQRSICGPVNEPAFIGAPFVVVRVK